MRWKSHSLWISLLGLIVGAKSSYGPDGNGTAAATSQDAITDTNATATSNTFFPFYLEVTVPTFCTRGDKIIVDASATNHQEKCIKVQFTLGVSNGSVPIPLNDSSRICICKGQRVSQRWSVDLTLLGDINITASASTTFNSTSANNCDEKLNDSEPHYTDTVMETIRVEAEGIKRKVTSSYLVIMEKSPTCIFITIDIPVFEVTTDSFKLHLQVVGDAVGPVWNNFNKLLMMPDGFCQQNLVRLLPVMYYVNYLTAMDNLDDEFLEKAKNELAAGYARQLACRRGNSAYSLFRNSNVPNSWLTIDTFFAFEKIKNLTFVDEKIQQKTLLYLRSLQNSETGCFSPTGSFYTIQNDEHNVIHFSAYVLMRLLLSGQYGTGDTLITNLTRCLENVTIEDEKIYTLAYVFHAAAVAKILPLWERLYTYLRKQNITEGGTVHWEPNDSRNAPFYSRRYTSSEVDITATIMLGILRGQRASADMDLLRQIATWLSFSQSATGGYIAPQDTIVAIEATIEYGRLVYVEDTNLEVDCQVIYRYVGEVADVKVNNDNKLQAQTHPLSSYLVISSMQVTINGTGNTVVQLIADFHSETTSQGRFSLIVTADNETCTDGGAPVINITICATYTGEGQTNTVYFDIKQLTGYSADRQSVYDLVTNGIVSDYGFEDNHVYCYLESMKSSVKTCFSIRSFQDQGALAYQDSTVLLQEPYNPDNSAFVTYRHPCSPSLKE